MSWRLISCLESETLRGWPLRAPRPSQISGCRHSMGWPRSYNTESRSLKHKRAASALQGLGCNCFLHSPPVLRLLKIKPVFLRHNHQTCGCPPPSPLPLGLSSDAHRERAGASNFSPNRAAPPRGCLSPAQNTGGTEYPK